MRKQLVRKSDPRTSTDYRQENDIKKCSLSGRGEWRWREGGMEVEGGGNGGGGGMEAEGGGGRGNGGGGRGNGGGGRENGG